MVPRLILILVSLLAVMSSASRSRPAEAASGPRDGATWLKSHGLYESLLSRTEAARYAVRPPAGTGPRGHEAANPAQALHARFEGGISVAPQASEGGDWRWTMRLDAYGHGDDLERVTTPVATASGNRVEYRYGRGLTEWYVNTARGVEQGFTLDAAAPGDRTSGRPLELVLTVGGNLAPRMARTGDEIEFASADGTAALGYRGLRAWDARKRILPSRMAIVSGQVRLIVDDREAEYPVTVDPLVFSPSKLTPSTTLAPIKPDDAFGFSVAISGNTAVVGSPFREMAPGVFKGAAFVFVRDSLGVWTQEAELQASDVAARPDEADLFGLTVSISGNTIVVGAPGNDPGGPKPKAGAVYVFVRTVASGVVTWSQQAKLAASDGAEGDAFGFAAAIGGDFMVVGAPNHNPDCKPLAGQAYIFLRNENGWRERARLPAGASVGDRFGYAVAISDSGVYRTVVVGAPAVSAIPTVPPTVPGRATVFVGIGGAWRKQAELRPEPVDVQNGDEFGFSVGLSDDTVVVGAPSHSLGGAAQAGASYVFVRSAVTWSHQAKLTASDEIAGDLFGSAVAVDKNTVVIGSPFRPPTAVGRAYVFTRSGIAWGEMTQQLKADPPAPFQFFGFAVAVSGANVAVGAPFYRLPSSAGPAYVFAPTVSFAGLWIGLANGADVGLRLDVRADVFAGAVKVAEGQTVDVSGGGSGFDNAILQTIPLSALGAFTSYTKVTISVRVTCFGPTSADGVARLWYNGRFQDTGAMRDAGSRVELSGLARTFLRKIGVALRLGFTGGTSKQFIDTFVGSTIACRPPGAPPGLPDRPFTEVGTFIF